MGPPVPPPTHTLTHLSPTLAHATLGRYMAGAGVAESCPTSGVYYEAPRETP